MQATADGTGSTITDTVSEERRPVRLLVPKRRGSTWYVPEEDTLRAYDLGLTRDTDDAQLPSMLRSTREMLRTAHITEDAETYLRRIRDGLRNPRDVDEAREWGMLVPEDINKEEFSDDLAKRTGWFWVIDPNRTETRAEREQRLRGDTRLVGMRAAARIWQRAYITVKDLKVESDRVREMIRSPEFLREEAAKFVDRQERKGITISLDAAIDKQLKYARKFVHKAMPVRRTRISQSDAWYVGDLIGNGRDNGRLDEWYERSTVRQTGRPPGSRTVHRRPHAAAA
jgi:hypothetical protein